MPYKHRYNDWDEGKIIWNDIESHKYEEFYISTDCIFKIQQRQQLILAKESKILIDIFIEQYSLNRRSDTNRNTTVNKLLQTIENLFNSDLSTFNDVIILDEEQANINSKPVEFKNKEIPPSNFTHLNAFDIKMIQSIFLDFTTSCRWNYTVIETPKRKELWKFVEFRGLLFAKTYYDFSIRLRQYDGLINNTFQSEFSYYKLTELRLALIRLGFIDKETDRDLFVKMFEGYYLMKHERINWLKNLDCLRYFIIQLDNKLKHQPQYGKWQVVSNCIFKNYSEINPNTVRKATKIDNYPKEKMQLDIIITALK